jgi:hypothetical protein
MVELTRATLWKHDLYLTGDSVGGGAAASPATRRPPPFKRRVNGSRPRPQTRAVDFILDIHITSYPTKSSTEIIVCRPSFAVRATAAAGRA